MKLKINYNECLTNLACSIRKYFGLEYRHNTLKYIDDILVEKNPENVILILFDGMGSKILKRTLNESDFFIKNMCKEITSVFPTTTTAATTSVLTGLDPVEHGYLGWNMYVKPIDKTITLFLNTEKGKDEICEEFIQVKSKLQTKDIIDEINDNKGMSALKLMPFGTNKYRNLDEMVELIEKETNKEGKKFIYAYDDEPDSSMHDFGADSEKVKNLIIERNNKIENLCKKLKNSLVIVVADHGQIEVDNIFLEDYPKIYKTLERTTSIENRAVSFKIKNGSKKQFVEQFNKEFGKYFKLFTKKEVIDKNFFGNGIPNELFDEALGDYIAIASSSNKALLTKDSSPLFSMHGGNNDDEVFIPLIVIDKMEK